MVYPNPQIYHHLKAIFVHVPKTAGTSIERTLRERETDVVGGHTTAQGYRRRFPALFDCYFKFAVVRHPVDRFISAFFYLLQQPVHPALGNAVVHESGSLECFVERVEQSPTIIFEIVHLMPQHQFICDDKGALLVDQLYRFEHLAAAWADITRRFGLPERSLPSSNQSTHRPWASYGAPKLLDTLRFIYIRDFALFNYARSIPPRSGLP